MTIQKFERVEKQICRSEKSTQQFLTWKLPMRGTKTKKPGPEKNSTIYIYIYIYIYI